MKLWLKLRFSNSGYYELLDFKNVTIFNFSGGANLAAVRDINSVAGLLKLFLRLLPISLITPSSYRELISPFRRRASEKETMTSLRKAMESHLPASHYSTLEALLKHLNLVAENSATNRMGADNLARIFLPNVLSTENSPMTSLSPTKSAMTQRLPYMFDGQHDLQMLMFLIVHVHRLF